MTISPDTAIEHLTRPWSDVLSPRETGRDTYTPIDYPPLLDMLSTAVRASLGRTAAGRSGDAERSLINLQAFQLLEHIDGTVRAWWREASRTACPTDLKEALTALHGTVTALHASGQIDTLLWEHITSQYPRWHARIWELFDPPVTKEITGPCPHCGQTAIEGDDGVRSWALVAYYRRDTQPEAKCQACGEHWLGERELLELGYSVGANVDEATITDMGVA